MDTRRNGYPFEAAFVETREVGDVCVAVIDARVLSDYQVEVARHKLCELATAYFGRIAISLSSTDGSSMGLFAALMHVRDHCARCNGKMVLFNLPDRTTDALVAFGIADKFTRADDLEQAIDMLHGRAATSGRGSWFAQLLGRGRAA